jgi:hypothetical protein
MVETCMRKMKNAYRVLVMKPAGKEITWETQG